MGGAPPWRGCDSLAGDATRKLPAMSDASTTDTTPPGPATLAPTAAIDSSHPAVQAFAVALVNSTRHSADLVLGASPRATLHLVRAAKAAAAMAGREYVVPDDLLRLAPQVLAHRLVATTEASMSGRRVGDILSHLLGSVPVPSPS